MRKVLTNPTIEITGKILINSDTVLVNYKYVDDIYDKTGNTNVAIASMVTGYARIKLYSLISAIENSSIGRVLYFYIDSVIFKDDISKGWYVPEIGNFLGDMTDEVVQNYGQGAYMSKFTSCGPKNYAYVVKRPNGKTKSKVKTKGIAITFENKDILNYELMKKTANQYVRGSHKETGINQLPSRIDRRHNFFTSEIKKMYRAVSDKQMFAPGSMSEYQTLPYGYKL